MKRYSEYKNSDVSWIGEIPEPWIKIKLKYCSDLINGYAFSSDSYVDDGIPIMRIGDIKPNIDLADTKKIPYELFDTCRSFKIKYGDILLALTGATIGKSAVFRLKDNALLNQRVAIIRPSKAITNGFLEHVIQSHLFKIHIDYECAGGAQDNIGKPEIGAYFAILPPIEEQKSIEKYLDHKTHLIDTLIEKKQKQIELLKEQRLAMINQAVTKGLDYNVKMKDSGIEWLGDIPEHWGIKRLKYLSQNGLKNGIFKKKDKFGRGTKLINVIDLYQENFRVKFDRLDRVELDEHEFKKYEVLPGDIFFVRSSLKLEGIGVSVCIDEVPEPTVFECHVVALKPKTELVKPLFLIYYLNSFFVRQRLVSLSETVTMSTLSQSKISSLETVVPPTNEQNLIIRFIERLDSKIFDMIRNIESSIERLKEYRTSLISEAVTGKIDVRDEVIS